MTRDKVSVQVLGNAKGIPGQVRGTVIMGESVATERSGWVAMVWTAAAALLEVAIDLALGVALPPPWNMVPPVVVGFLRYWRSYASDRSWRPMPAPDGE